MRKSTILWKTCIYIYIYKKKSYLSWSHTKPMHKGVPTCTDGLKKVVKSWGGAWDVGVGGCWGGTIAIYCPPTPPPGATPAPPLPPLTYPRFILMPYKEQKSTHHHQFKKTTTWGTLAYVQAHSTVNLQSYNSLSHININYSTLCQVTGKLPYIRWWKCYLKQN